MFCTHISLSKNKILDIIKEYTSNISTLLPFTISVSQHERLLFNLVPPVTLSKYYSFTKIQQKRMQLRIVGRIAHFINIFEAVNRCFTVVIL